MEKPNEGFVVRADLRIEATSPHPMGVRGTGWKTMREIKVHDGNLMITLAPPPEFGTEITLTFSQAKTEEIHRALMKALTPQIDWEAVLRAHEVVKKEGP